MYLNDLLAQLEKALGLADGAAEGVTARETRILGEIARLRRPKAQRLPAASKERLQRVARQVTLAMLDGEVARAVALRHEIGEEQARAVFAEQVRAACRQAVQRGGLQPYASGVYMWIGNKEKKAVLSRAKADANLVKAALVEYWRAQDALMKERQV